MKFELSDEKIYEITKEEQLKNILSSIKANNYEYFILGENIFIQAAFSDPGYLLQYKINSELKESKNTNIPFEEIKKIFIQFFKNDYSFIDKYQWNTIANIKESNNDFETNQQNSNTEEDIFKDPVSFLKSRAKNILKSETKRVVKNKTSKIIRKGIGGILKKIIK